MKRLTERIVSNGCPAASARARAPTTISPLGRKLTAEGRSSSPVSGSGRTRGPPSSSTATRLFVVPRSMPTIGAIVSFSDRLVDVAEERVEIGDLGETAAQVVEPWPALRVGGHEPGAQLREAAREAFTQPVDV